MTELDEQRDPTAAGATRRTVLLSAGALGAAGILAACGDDASPTNPATTPPPADPTTDPTTAAKAEVKAADVPVGGGTILKDENVVVTQPAAGTFKAFDATCQHLGCQVSSVTDGKINCACHGSQYTIADGSVARGPTTAGLPEKTVTVSGDTLTVTLTGTVT